MSSGTPLTLTLTHTVMILALTGNVYVALCMCRGLEKAILHPPDYGEQSYGAGSGKLKDKICLMTGGDSGIGRAVVFAFAREGAKGIAFSHLSEEQADADDTSKLIEKAGAASECKSAAMVINLDTDAACKRLIDFAVHKFGRIDVLVLNHVTQRKAVTSLEEMTAQSIYETFKVNIASFFHLTRHALPFMKPDAVIITTDSIQAYNTSPAIGDYAFTKAAIVNFTNCYAKELMTLHGIRVNWYLHTSSSVDAAYYHSPEKPAHQKSRI